MDKIIKFHSNNQRKIDLAETKLFYRSQFNDFMNRENADIHPNASEFIIKKEKYAQINGIQIYYECDNVNNQNTSQPALLFLHGWTANRFRLHPLYMLYLQQGFPVFRFDLRGHGWSQKEGIKDFSLQSMKADLNSFIKKVIIEEYHFKKVNIIAHSMGGSITQLLAINSPDYLEKVILMASSCRWADTWTEKLKWMLFTGLYTFNHDKKYEKKKPGHVIWGLEHFPMWDSKYLPPHRDLKTIRKATIQGLKEMHRLHICKQLHNIKIPVLIIAGEEDTAAPIRYSQKLHEMLPNSHLEIISGVNHDIAIGKPHTAKKLIDQFL